MCSSLNFLNIIIRMFKFQCIILITEYIYRSKSSTFWIWINQKSEQFSWQFWKCIKRYKYILYIYITIKCILFSSILNHVFMSAQCNFHTIHGNVWILPTYTHTHLSRILCKMIIWEYFTVIFSSLKFEFPEFCKYKKREIKWFHTYMSLQLFASKKRYRKKYQFLFALQNLSVCHRVFFLFQL